MKALFVMTLDGEKVINLNNVTQIEYNNSGGGSTPSLDVYVVGSVSPIRFPLSQAVKSYHIIERLRAALQPLYEGRQGTVLGIALDLDISDLQVREARF